MYILQLGFYVGKEVNNCLGNCCAVRVWGQLYRATKLGNPFWEYLATAVLSFLKMQSVVLRSGAWHSTPGIRHLFFLRSLSTLCQSSISSKGSSAPYPCVLLSPQYLLLSFTEFLCRIICVNWQQLMTESVNSERQKVNKNQKLILRVTVTQE